MDSSGPPLELSHTVMLRLWFESSASLPGGGEWRGSARDAESGKVVYFRELEGVADALRRLQEPTR